MATPPGSVAFRNRRDLFKAVMSVMSVCRSTWKKKILQIHSSCNRKVSYKPISHIDVALMVTFYMDFMAKAQTLGWLFLKTKFHKTNFS